MVSEPSLLGPSFSSLHCWLSAFIPHPIHLLSSVIISVHRETFFQYFLFFSKQYQKLPRSCHQIHRAFESRQNLPNRELQNRIPLTELMGETISNGHKSWRHSWRERENSVIWVELEQNLVHKVSCMEWRRLDNYIQALELDATRNQ